MRCSSYLVHAFMLACILVGGACGKKDHHTLRKVTQNTPNEKGEDIEVMYTDSGNLRARLRAPLVEHFKNSRPYIEMKKGLLIHFYDKTNPLTPSSMLKANYGIKYENEQKVIVKNDVVAVNINNDTLNTELLIWDELKKKIYSNKPVRIKKKDEIIYGDGFESNEDFTQYKIFHITGTFKRNVENP